MNNKLIIAGAGTGKTKYLIDRAIEIKEKVLITTFTINCKNEIIDKIIKRKGYVPKNINVQTWFSVLLQHGVKPYKRTFKINNVKGVNMTQGRSGLRYRGKRGPVYWGEEDFDKFYFDSNNNIYTDKLSKLVIRIDNETHGKVIDRLTSIYNNIFLDEVQDMAGYDLEFIKRLMNSNSNIILVGDPRQTVYKTHYEQKYKKYSDGNIENFIREECKKIECDVDNTTLNRCYRCHKDIIIFVNNFYNDYTPMKSTEIEEKEHQGVFTIKKSQIEEYIRKYNPVQIIYDSRTITSKLSQTITMGKSKGATYNRVLLYPTGEFKNYIINGNASINIGTKNKLYVGMTRPINSLTFVIDDDNNAFRIKKWFGRGVENDTRNVRI